MEIEINGKKMGHKKKMRQDTLRLENIVIGLA